MKWCSQGAEGEVMLLLSKIVAAVRIATMLHSNSGGAWLTAAF